MSSLIKHVTFVVIIILSLIIAGCVYREDNEHFIDVKDTYLGNSNYSVTIIGNDQEYLLKEAIIQIQIGGSTSLDHGRLFPNNFIIQNITKKWFVEFIIYNDIGDGALEQIEVKTEVQYEDNDNDEKVSKNDIISIKSQILSGNFSDIVLSYALSFWSQDNYELTWYYLQQEDGEIPSSSSSK